MCVIAFVSATIFLSKYPLLFVKSIFELPRDKTNKTTCAPTEDSDQPDHPPCLIGVFAEHSKGSQGPKISSCGQRRL